MLNRAFDVVPSLNAHCHTLHRHRKLRGPTLFVHKQANARVDEHSRITGPTAGPTNRRKPSWYTAMYALNCSPNDVLKRRFQKPSNIRVTGTQCKKRALRIITRTL